MDQNDQMEIDPEKRQKEEQAAKIALAMMIISLVLFAAAVIHSAVYLGKATDKTRSIRIGFLFIALIFGPIYWLIYPIVYLAGGFKN